MSSEFIEVEEDLNLEEVVDNCYESTSMNNKLIYPCLIISGLSTQAELEYLIHREVKTKNSLPLYVQFADNIQMVNNIDFDLDTFQAIRQIHNYDITLCKTVTDSVKIDLENPETFVKLIKI